ncbi:MAG: hypothetical protein B6229_05450 [Spirochaetaceae bacterium 4572_7]|nr:MAG: hypothetical protein B6229_05450 [Spirochaetaceae bacterium 4572_7]
MEGDSIIFSANYILEPVSSNKDYILEINTKSLRIIIPRQSNNKILFLGTKYSKITDRIEIFLK